MPYQLYIEYSSSGKIYLDGANIAAPVAGTRYAPGRGDRWLDELGREVITEELQITLNGTYRSVTDWINTLSALVEAQKIGTRHPIANLTPLRLVAQDQDDAAYGWYSYILDAALTLDPNGLAARRLGKQFLLLKITRLDRWEYANRTRINPLFAPSGDQDSAGYMLNHRDSSANHTNWAYFAAAGVKGDLPNRLNLSNGAVGISTEMGDFYLGCGWCDQSGNVADFVSTLQESDFAAGAGVTKTEQSSASAAGGAYANFTWAATGETRLFYAVIPQNLYKNELSHGRPLKPIGRLHTGLAKTDLWLRAKVLIGGTAVVSYETEWVLYPSGSAVLELPPVYAPPEGVAENYQLYIAIYARKTDPGSYTLSLDFLQLWPVDGGFRVYRPVVYPSGYGYYTDNSEPEELYWFDAVNFYKRSIVQAFGPPLRMLPGGINVLMFANVQDGTGWNIDDAVYLSVYPIWAKRNL